MECLQYSEKLLYLNATRSSSFKPCYKWNAFNTFKPQTRWWTVECFKPCYKWNAFNTERWMDEGAIQMRF